MNPPLPYRRYELSEKQKDYLNYQMLISLSIRKRILKVLDKFKKDNYGHLYWRETSCDKIDDNILFNLLKQTNFFQFDGDTIRLNEKYENELIVTILSPKGISLQDYFKIAAENALRGSLAEKYVIEFEKQRLKNLSGFAKIDKIKYISPQNVSAGYDIESFNSSKSKYYDRYIEVKSGQSTKIHFFITRNELDKAKDIGPNYWLYYVKMVSRTPKSIKLYQNPVKSILNSKKFDTRINTLEVMER